MFDRAQSSQEKIKSIFDRKTKPEDFQVADLVYLRWDTVREEKGEHGKYEKSMERSIQGHCICWKECLYA